MPSNDTALLDLLESLVDGNYGRVSIELAPTYLQGPSAWKVGYKSESPDLYASGGGETLREALERLATNITKQRILGEPNG